MSIEYDGNTPIIESHMSLFDQVKVKGLPVRLVHPLVGSRWLTWHDFLESEKETRKGRRRFRNAGDCYCYLSETALSLSPPLQSSTPWKLSLSLSDFLSPSPSAFLIHFLPISDTENFLGRAPARAYLRAFNDSVFD